MKKYIKIYKAFFFIHITKHMFAIQWNWTGKDPVVRSKRETNKA